VGLVVVAATSAAPRGTTAIFVVQPAPRLCPSPLCGGSWVAAANRARTTCSDGLRRPRCYVAEVSTEESPVVVPPGSLVHGTLVARRYGDLGTLGTLAADTVWTPLGQASGGRFFRLRDLGNRCVRAPCFSLVGTRLNGTGRITLSALDFGAVSARERARVEAAVASKAGVLAQGRVAATSEGGRAFLASRFFLEG